MSKFLTCWQGPFEISRRINPVSYKVLRWGNKKEIQVFHVNLLKLWKEPNGLLVASALEEERLGRGTGGPDPEQWTHRGVLLGSHSMNKKQSQLKDIVKDFQDIFSETPGCTRDISNSIVTPEGKILREK